MRITVPRINTAWLVGGTETFRNKSRKLFKTYGTNLQNLSDNVSRILIPRDENHVFVSADCAGAEALIVAYLCRAANFRMLFNVGIKPHVFVALHLFADHWRKIYDRNIISAMLSSDPANLYSIPSWKEVAKTIKNHERYYFIGKKACHSFNYRKMPSTFIYDVLKESEGKVVLTKQEAERIHSVYHRLFPEIEEWHREIDYILRKTRTLYNLYGYPNKFYGIFTDKFFREATAWVPQSTIGCLTNIAFCNLQWFIEENNLDWDVVLNKHDSIMADVPKEESSIACEIIKASLEQELISPRGEKFTMKSEVSVGRNGGKYNAIDNLEGLKEI
jgi:hypothetical protein